MLRGDLSRARGRLVICSAFMTQNRLAELQSPILAAVERGVEVFVVTKAHADRSKTELTSYRSLERALANWGVIVIHKRGMHEKLVFIDDNIVWSGSLNPLSFRNTQEIMERRHSPRVVEDFVKVLRLDDLIGEYEPGPPTCPICESEIVAREGKDDPFFWQCSNQDCKYSRSIDQPPITDGIILCANRHCGAAVEYGEWGKKPAWRCVENRHHHQKIMRTHLRLPKMRAIIPNRKLQKLDKMFKIDLSEATSGAEDPPEQLSLFDMDL